MVISVSIYLFNDLHLNDFHTSGSFALETRGIGLQRFYHRGREVERDTETDRQGDRQRDRQKERERDRLTRRKMERLKDRGQKERYFLNSVKLTNAAQKNTII